MISYRVFLIFLVLILSEFWRVYIQNLVLTNVGSGEISTISDLALCTAHYNPTAYRTTRRTTLSEGINRRPNDLNGRFLRTGFIMRANNNISDGNQMLIVINQWNTIS